MHNSQAQLRRKSQSAMTNASFISDLNRMVKEDGYTIKQLAGWWDCSESQMRGILDGTVKVESITIGEAFNFMSRAADGMETATRLHGLTHSASFVLVPAETVGADGDAMAELCSAVVTAAQLAVAAPIHDADAIEAVGRDMIATGYRLVGDAGAMRATRTGQAARHAYAAA